MNILFIVDEFPKISETFILNQITGLIDRGHNVTILASNNSKEDKVHPDVFKYKLIDKTIYYDFKKGKIERISSFIKYFIVNFFKQPSNILKTLNIFKYKPHSYSLRLFFSLIALKGTQNYDIIHCHFGPNGLLGLYLKEIGCIKGKLYTTFHGHDMTAYLKENGNNCYHKLLEEGDCFLPISTFWKNKLIQLGCDSDKIIIHRMGVDLEKFPFEVIPPSTDTFKIITVARLVEKKGVEFAIRAVSELMNKGLKIEYNIVGDGPLNKHLTNIIEQCGRKSSIKILGWKNQDEIINLLKESNLNIVPSVTSENGDMEGLPVVIMESMAMGIPVLSTFHSGIPEIIEDNRTGYLVNERNVEEIIQKLEYILRNKNELKSISFQAREKVKIDFNINTLNETLEQIFLNEENKIKEVG